MMVLWLHNLRGIAFLRTSGADRDQAKHEEKKVKLLHYGS